MIESTYAILLEILDSDLAMDPARVRLDSTLIGDLGFDSVAFAISVVAIEERLHLRLSEEKLFACKTFGDVVQLIDDSKGASSSEDTASLGSVQDRTGDLLSHGIFQRVGSEVYGTNRSRS